MAQQVIYPSAARTATPPAVEVLSGYARGLHLVIDVTAVTLTPSVTPLIQGVDELSGKAYTLLEGAAITAVSTVVLRVYPALTDTANLAANDVLPDRIRVSMAHGDADSITYSVAAHLVD